MKKGKFRFWDFDQKQYVYSNEVLQMSATDISTCNECEFKFYYKLTKEIRFPKNVYLIMGSVFHAVIENDLRYKAEKGVNKKWQDLEKVFDKEWEKGKAGCDFSKSKITEEQAKYKCKNYAQIYSIKMSPLLYPVGQEGIEKFFRCYVHFSEKRLGITGKVDLIDKSFWITDHKTSSSEWTQQDADKEIQAQLYPWAIRNLGFDVQGFKFNVVSKNTVNVFPVTYNQSKVKEILTRAFEIKRNLEEDNISRAKSEKVCKFCDYKNLCSESLLQKDENIEDL